MNKNIDISNYIKIGLSPWFLSNITIYIILIAWITRATKIFYILLSPLIVNAIIGTILIIVYWDKIIIKYKLDFAKNNGLSLDDVNNVINKNKTIETIFKIMLILIHYVPIIIFYYLGYFDKSMTDGISGMAMWILGTIFVSIYLLIVSINKKIYELYGKSNKELLISYPFILLIVCNYIFKY